MNASMFETYLSHRDDGCSPRTAAQMTARLYGKTDPEDARALQVTLEALEARDRPPGAGEPAIRIPTGVASLYLSERRAGRSDADATRAVGHSYQYDPAQLDHLLKRPREQFRRELEAWTPSDTSHSIEEIRR